MAKIRKSLIGALMCLILLFIGVCTLTACGSKDYTVTFSIEGKEQTVDVVDGKVTFPADPTKEYYEFRGWYTTDTFDEGTEFTSETKISGNVKVYAYFAPIYVNISVNGSDAEEIKLENLSSKTTEYSADATDKNLTFDGWYLDSGYTTEYTVQETDNLYARYIATIVFNNGFEDLQTQEVMVNAKVAAPDLTSSDFVKSYMDSEDISYRNADGEAIDINNYVATSNETITVLWKSPHLAYEQNDAGDWICRGFETVDGINYNYSQNGFSNTIPVVSILSDVTYNGNLIHVVGARYQDSASPVWTGPTKLIFGEGIEYIGGFADSAFDSWMVEEISLPSTLKIIDNAFWGMPKLKSVTIPNGVETIINSFWLYNYTSVDFKNLKQRTGYSFDIAIPDSVTNLSQAPTNFTFSSRSCFTKDSSDRIYKTDEKGRKILIADYNIVDGTLIVEEGVQGIQVGTFSAMPELMYLILPSTWSFVGYNPDVTAYSYYLLSGETNSRNLFNAQYKDDPIGHMNSEAYTIVNQIDLMDGIVVYQTTYPENLNSSALAGCTTSSTYLTGRTNFADYTNSKFISKVLFSGKVDEGSDCTVYISTQNSIVSSESGSYQLIVKSGNKITREQILEAAGLTGSLIAVEQIKQFGLDYDFDSVVESNLYIDISYGLNTYGFTTETNSDGTLTVTGFDESSAYRMESGKYLVYIPTEKDGKMIVAIAAEAFKNNLAIESVYISGSVKEIGNSAFYGCSNLTTLVFTSKGIEKIGGYAFYGTSFTTVALPLENLNEVGAYAFKQDKLQYFTRYEGEENRMIYTKDESDPTASVEFTGLKSGMFFLLGGSSTQPVSLVKYVSMTETTDPGDSSIKVKMYDVDLIAVAGGSTLTTFTVGYTTRTFLNNVDGRDAVIRFKVKEGSVYYLAKSKTIFFGLVSYVEASGFTDMGDTQRTINGFNYTKARDGITYLENWFTTDEIHAIDSSIFAEGWWCGLSSESEEYTTGIKLWMEAAKYYSWTPAI